MRPPLTWQKGQPITHTRMTTPREAVRIASLPESYLDTVRTIDADDSFLFQCVNMGVPVRTATDIYSEMIKVLGRAGVKPTLPSGLVNTPNPTMMHEKRECTAMMSGIANSFDSCRDIISSYGAMCIRAMQVDSGCDYSMGFTVHNDSLRDAKRARCIIQVADKDTTMSADKQGS